MRELLVGSVIFSFCRYTEKARTSKLEEGRQAALDQSRDGLSASKPAIEDRLVRGARRVRTGVFTHLSKNTNYPEPGNTCQVASRSAIHRCESGMGDICRRGV